MDADTVSIPAKEQESGIGFVTMMEPSPSFAVDVVCDDAATTQWLAETVAPWFVIESATSAVPQVRAVVSAERYAALQSRKNSVPLHDVACFDLDSSVFVCSGWTEPDGTTVAHDADFRCFYGLHPQQMEIVMLPGDERARVGLLRVVRELATLQAAAWSPLDLHGAGLVWNGRAILLLGEKKSGKTTLLAHALSGGQTALLANDRVLVVGEQAFGVPTLARVREQTQAFFPALATDPHAVLGPQQFAQRLGAGVVPKAPVGAILFPTVEPERESWTLEPLSASEGKSLVAASLYGQRSGPRPTTWFRRTFGRDRDSALEEVNLAELCARVPMARIRLGKDAYREKAIAWLSSLPLVHR